MREAFNAMPQHDAGLLALALLAALVLIGMAMIDYLCRRDEQELIDAFMESGELADLERERERFWRWVHGADEARQAHLDESEAAAITHSERVHP